MVERSDPRIDSDPAQSLARAEVNRQSSAMEEWQTAVGLVAIALINFVLVWVAARATRRSRKSGLDG